MFISYHSTTTDEYRNHTSCISEAERYEKTIYRGSRKLDESGTGHRGQQQRGKKLTPQEAWANTIQTAADNAPASLKSYMNQLTMCENVPRQEKKFRNFTNNSLRCSEKVKSEIWALLVEVRAKDRQAKEEEEARRKREQQQQKEKQLTEKKKTKLISESSDDESSKSSSTTSELPSKKVITKAIKKVLKKAPNNQLKFKALRKQIHESLAFKANKSGKKKMKKLLQESIAENPKKMKIDGKLVTLTK